MAINPLGAVWASDFGNPKVISAVAREAISGGQFVFSSGATAVVSSGLSSFVTSDVKVMTTGASGANFLGIALQNAASGALVPVAVEGTFLLNCIGAVTSSYPVVAIDNTSVSDVVRIGSQAAVNSGSGVEFPIGKALTAGASGGYAAIFIK
jgi:hypothetical protein